MIITKEVFCNGKMTNLNEISKKSHKEIEAKCDLCGNIRTIQYRRYNQSVDNNGIFCCSRKCSFDIQSKKLFDECGVVNKFQLDYIKEKSKLN